MTERRGSVRASSAGARRRMQACRGRDTLPERVLRSELFRRGLRYRVDRVVLRGVRRRADVVFGPARVAVFVDGCFWHGCPMHGTQAKSNAGFWAEKVAANQRRDADTNERLSTAGWAVVRVWEHELREHADVVAVAERIERLVSARRTPRS